ncbi:myosin-binding protein C, fast-type-like isoform X1 [Dendropsophus ebraccatus]|uniref:myosin-binding protein C, fast-type-like isoform X1 n=1 Tax=Dendropsophus ebraccatus TaxID=150705 RepID=UPI0038312EA3
MPEPAKPVAKKGVGPAKKPVKPAAKPAEAAKVAAAPPAEAPPAEAPPAEAPPAESPLPGETSEEQKEYYDEDLAQDEDYFEDISSYEHPEAEVDLSTHSGLFVKKPHDLTVETGKDFHVNITVNGTQLTAKPTVKWFKGKWLELGSKSGTRYKFEDSYDEAKKLYQFGLKVFKAVKADNGSYRCEVASPDNRENCTFSVSVQDAGDDGNILKAFKRTPSGEGKGRRDAGELDFSALLKKTEREKKEKKEVKKVESRKKDDDDPMANIPPHVLEILRNAKPSEYEKIAFQNGITDLRGMLKHLKKKKVQVQKQDAFTRRLDNCYTVDRHQKIKMQVEITNPDLPIKWLKNGHVIKPSAKYVFENIGLKRILIINKCTLADDAEYACVVGDDRSSTELFVQEPPITIEKPLEDQQVFVGDKVELEVEVSEEGAQVTWTKDGVELTRDEMTKYRFRKDGRKHILIINEATKDDIGRYGVETNGGACEAELVVEDKKLEILQGIADLTVKAAEQAVFKCEVSDEKVTGKWLKNGVEIRPSKRITMTHKGRIHKLVIDDVRPEDEADYTFVPDGYALSLSAKLNFLEVVIEYVPLEEPPKIHLDCSGGTPVNTIIVVAGNKLRFDVPITGEPAPTVTWFKENVEFTDIDGRVHIDPKPDLSSFFIDGAKREDEGNYKIVVTNPSGEDSAALYVKVVDVPDPPENINIVCVGEDWADVVWEPPKYDGGQEILGYYIERKKKGSQRWMKMNFEPYTDTKYQSTNMIEGVLYEIRIFAVNAIGISREANTTNPFMPIAPTSEPLHLTVEDVTDTTCTLKWRPPDRIGAGGIDGYLIEYCKEGSDEWVAANKEFVERCGYTVKGLPTGEKLFFRVCAVNIAGRSEPATLGNAVTIREIVQSPKIRLPRQLRQTYVKKVGEQVNLVIPFQGKPRPVVTWTKDGQPLDPKQVSVRTSDSDTIIFIRSSERHHSGKYDLSVQIENMVDIATVNIRIVDKPGPPQTVMVKEVWGFNALLEWKPPKDNGNSEITGYTVQKADKKTMEWFTVYEHNRQPRCTVSDLIMGNEYYFRVYSDNIVGLSEAAGVSKNTAVIEKTGLVYKPRDYREMDINEAPKFLTPLIDRVVVAGYSTALNCAVRGHPKPRVIWMKNKMEIKDDPKFLMKHNQGVLTLNIRKPSPFDGGTYTCKAINELGEAEVDCRLEVRVPQ